MTGNQAGGTWHDALVERHPDLFQVGTDGRIPGRPTVDDGLARDRVCEHAVGEPVPVTRDLENVHIVRAFDGSRRPIACCRRYMRETDSFVDVSPRSLGVME